MGSVAGIDRPTLRAQQLRREATPAERRLWQALSASKLGAKFSRQMPVGPYICDFLCRSALLAIDLDCDSHATQLAYDARRDALIRSRGIRILRFSNAEVMGNLDGVLHVIASTLANSPPPTPPASGRGA